MPRLSLLYCGSLAIVVANTILWPLDGTGFIAGRVNPASYCSVLMSSGGDDDAMIFALVIFALPMALRIARFHRPWTRIESVLYGFSWLGAIFAYFLATMDCAAPVATAVIDHDLQLIAIFTALGLNCVAAASLFRGAT
ncbi:hypothetical protein [Celeribacter litoreus]|uniref:hypothetical protein n=1 Tax=Celeribacter litoreus TaxID=2876714 RepID=UPI001CCC85D0|nr:hypothetical protein [Celeribacter litoreus]MCA0045197.1 hypothetical protein [Celeribacter litoreus]